MQKAPSLSKRLTALFTLCSHALADSRPYVLTDVGCDHAHVPICLLQEGIVSRAVCADILPGPLEKAKENLARYDVPEGQVELVLSDGLDAISPGGEREVLLIAGMGGRAIEDILLRKPKKTMAFRELILQPQNEAGAVRGAVEALHYRIAEEEMVEEKGKFYPMLRAVQAEEEFPAGNTLQLLYGPRLLEKKDNTLRRYLLRGKEKMTAVLNAFPEDGNAEERMELLWQLEQIRAALLIIGEEETS